jgi:uncharacterized protein (DUF1015 family)
MVNIIPFRGLRYNSAKVQLSEVVAPPYDVISEEEQTEYHEKKECNVIRLILGRDRPGDDPQSNKYTRAAAYLDEWLEHGVLIRDGEPSIYVYEEEYRYRGKKRVMRGFIALAGLEELGEGSILPHEETLRGPVKDRLALIRACRANFSSIFTVYSDPSGAVEESLNPENPGELVADVVAEGVRHRLWRVSNPGAIKGVVEGMRDKQVLIADGHHRYETALNFWRETGEEKHGYVMMYFTNMDRSGITILPAHRVVRGLKNLSIDDLTAKLGRYFSIIDFPIADKGAARRQLLKRMLEMNRTKHVLGMYIEGKYFLLSLIDEKILDKIGDQRKSREWRRLDVSIVHSLVLKHILGIEADGDDVVYVTDAGEAVELVEKGLYQLAIFVNPTKLAEVKNIAMRGERMPGKATYFYPKLLTGLVMNKLD